MKAAIHPTYFHDTMVTCSCGNTFVTGSTIKSISVEVCYKCHPFYTGEHKFIDAKGYVEKFNKKQQIAQEYKAKYGSKKDKNENKGERQGKSLRELLGEV